MITTYTISTDDSMMSDIEAASVADALEQFGAPQGVRDVPTFEAWLEKAGGSGYIEENGVRIASVKS